jgi:hypothetical protein
MSTQAVITFKDQHGEYSIFRHWDGYPSGVIPDLDALFKSNFVWPLPRFEADEAAAGMIAMFKRDPGNYRLTDAKMGKNYGYCVEMRDGAIFVTVGGHDGVKSGTLPEMLEWSEDKH